MDDDRKNVVDMDGGRVDDDHLLSMYIDNELDAEQTISLVGRLKSEPVLRTRLTQLEDNDGVVKQVYAQSAVKRTQSCCRTDQCGQCHPTPTRSPVASLDDRCSSRILRGGGSHGTEHQSGRRL